MSYAVCRVPVDSGERALTIPAELWRAGGSFAGAFDPDGAAREIHGKDVRAEEIETEEASDLDARLLHRAEVDGASL